VLEAFPRAVILRPSIVFGPEDEFFNRFAQMTRMGPILPVVGADTRFQPVYVDDVAKAAVMGVTGAGRAGHLRAGRARGAELPRADAADAGRDPPPSRLIVNVPFWIARIMGPCSTCFRR
jgi:uncharacterized protein YbjT (DUF2867 family)